MIDQQGEEQHAAVMAIAHALTPAAQAQFLAKTRTWRGLDGAHVADVLDMTISHDSFLDKTEPFFDTYGGQLPECGNFAALAAVHALIILDQPVDPARVTSLLQKAGVTAAPYYPAEVGILLEDGETANALLIFTKAEAAMRAAGVPEDRLTEFRQEVRSTGVPGYSRNVGDIARWVTLVGRYTPPVPNARYDPVHDLAVIIMEAYAGDYRSRTSPQLAQALANLRERIDLTSTEGLEPSLRELLKRVS